MRETAGRNFIMRRAPLSAGMNITQNSVPRCGAWRLNKGDKALWES